MRPRRLDHFATGGCGPSGELIHNQVRLGLARNGARGFLAERMTTHASRRSRSTLINLPRCGVDHEFFGHEPSSRSYGPDQPAGRLRQTPAVRARPVAFPASGPARGPRRAPSPLPADVAPSRRPEARTRLNRLPCPTTRGWNPFGFVETPYRKVVDGRVTDQNRLPEPRMRTTVTSCAARTPRSGRRRVSRTNRGAVQCARRRGRPDPAGRVDYWKSRAPDGVRLRDTAMIPVP